MSKIEACIMVIVVLICFVFCFCSYGFGYDMATSRIRREAIQKKLGKWIVDENGNISFEWITNAKP